MQQNQWGLRKWQPHSEVCASHTSHPLLCWWPDRTRTPSKNNAMSASVAADEVPATDTIINHGNNCREGELPAGQGEGSGQWAFTKDMHPNLCAPAVMSGKFSPWVGKTSLYEILTDSFRSQQRSTLHRRNVQWKLYHKDLMQHSLGLCVW